jgi:hypothetical protein
MTVADRASTLEMPVHTAAFEAFKTGLRGKVIRSGELVYDVEGRVHSGTIDRYARLIARCRDVADVISCRPLVAPRA